MAIMEERVAYIEGHMQMYPQMFTMLREDIAHLRTEMGQNSARLEERMSRQFMWTVGIQVTTLLAVVGALLSRA